MNRLVEETNELLRNGGFDYAFCGGQAPEPSGWQSRIHRKFLNNRASGRMEEKERMMKKTVNYKGIRGFNYTQPNART